MRRPLHLRAALLVSVAALVAAGVSCTDDADGGTDPTARVVDIYAAAIEAVVDDAGLPPAEEDQSIPIYVMARGDDQISAEVQAGVVVELEPWATVRFIDEIDEAVDLEAEDPHVRNDGVFLGLGPVSEGEATAQLNVDRWRSADDTVVYDLTVRRRGGEWQVERPLDKVVVDGP